MTPDDSGLWPFALRVYGAPGVAAACLDLQERDGVDVPFLLFAGWMGARGVSMPADVIARLDSGIADWRVQMVHPLRALRRTLKQGPPPAPDDRTEKLREAIKAAELSAEKIELDQLEAMGRTHAATGAPAVGDNLRRAVAHYAGRSPDPDAIVAIDLIAAAMAQRSPTGGEGQGY